MNAIAAALAKRKPLLQGQDGRDASSDDADWSSNTSSVQTSSASSASTSRSVSPSGVVFNISDIKFGDAKKRFQQPDVKPVAVASNNEGFDPSQALAVKLKPTKVAEQKPASVSGLGNFNQNAIKGGLKKTGRDLTK